jgi:hypothetical protein
LQKSASFVPGIKLNSKAKLSPLRKNYVTL